MNLTGVIPKVTCPTTLTETEEDPDPGIPDPTLVLNAVAMTAAKTGQVQPQLVSKLAAPMY